MNLIGLPSPPAGLFRFIRLNSVTSIRDRFYDIRNQELSSGF